ncbi:hypothetical protein KSS87_005598 [Heliosperma pusillum]|nr:hypothetical protein KSS87_005598 [Heliosperma pusillum]
MYTSSASSVNGHEFISLLETQTEDFGVGLQLESFIRTDNKQGFVSFFNSQQFNHRSIYFGFETRLFKLICFRRAIGCATALLNGETGLPTVDLNYGLAADPLEDEVGDNPTPIEIAARILCYGLTKLFIEHGADLSLFCYESRGALSRLPLKLALDTFCDHTIVKDFPAGESVDKLFSLFRLQELKEPLETIEFLASRTKQVMILGVCSVEERNLVKLSALLIVAWDKLVIDDDIYSSPVAKLIGLQHDVESDLEKKQIMRSMLQALKLVEMSRSFLKENHKVSMAEVQQAILFKHVECSVDKARPMNHATNKPIVKVLLETRLMKKMCSKSMNTECIYFLPKSPEPERDIRENWTDSFYGHVCRAMCLDDRHEFVKVVNGVEPFGSVDPDDDDNLPEIVREFMFEYDSANCAAAVLAGETDAFLTFKDLTDVGWSFLHNAAKLANPKLTALFLENGFPADDRRDSDELKIKAALPLNVALERMIIVSKNGRIISLPLILWRFSVMTNLYGAPDLRLSVRFDAFYTILWLLSDGIFLLFLLFLSEEYAGDSHKELLTSAFMDTLVLTSITQNAGGAGHARKLSTSTGHEDSHGYNDPIERKMKLLLLGIFGKIGDYLSAYIRLEHLQIIDVQTTAQTNSEVAWLLVRAGISDGLVSKMDDTLFRIYFADHKRVLGSVNRNSGVQQCGPKVGIIDPVLNTYWKQAPGSMLWTRGTSSSVVFSRAVPTPFPNIRADFASLASAKGLVDVLRHRHRPMWCKSMVAALTSGFKRI